MLCTLPIKVVLSSFLLYFLLRFDRIILTFLWAINAKKILLFKPLKKAHLLPPLPRPINSKGQSKEASKVPNKLTSTQKSHNLFSLNLLKLRRLFKGPELYQGPIKFKGNLPNHLQLKVHLSLRSKPLPEIFQNINQKYLKFSRNLRYLLSKRKRLNQFPK